MTIFMLQKQVDGTWVNVQAFATYEAAETAQSASVPPTHALGMSSTLTLSKALNQL